MVDFARTIELLAALAAVAACAKDPKIQPLTKGFVEGSFSASDAAVQACRAKLAAETLGQAEGRWIASLGRKKLGLHADRSERCPLALPGGLGWQQPDRRLHGLWWDGVTAEDHGGVLPKTSAK